MTHLHHGAAVDEQAGQRGGLQQGATTIVAQIDRYEMYRPVPTEEMPTGYYGRQAIVELIQMSDGLRRLVMQQATSGEMQELAVTEGMRTMYQDGLLKCLQGVTTVEEVLRVTQES